MKPNRTRRTRQQGLALIEVLIAALIFALGSLALIQLNATLVRHAEAARQRSEATLLAQARLDELRTLLQWHALGSPLTAAAGEAGPDGVRGHDAPGDAQGTPFDRRWRIAEYPDSGLRRIEVQVGWTDRDGRAEASGVALALLLAPTDPLHSLRAARRTDADDD
jgi:type II secretory pathway pseudopilin PulG